MADVNETNVAVESNEVETVETAAEAKTKAPAKKKATARKATARKKPAARKAPAKKKAAAKKKPSPAQEFATRAREAGRDAFLASLGFYGKAFDQAQDQFENLQERLEERRKKANKLYQELVKRGEKVESDARSKFEDLDLPRFELDSLTDRTKLEAQLEKAKARFEELKDSVSSKKAA